MTVYDKLRLLGEAVTQEKAAEAMGVSPYYFRQVLRDKYRVGRHYIENLASVYPIDVDDFLDETKDFTPPAKKRRLKKKKKPKPAPKPQKMSKRCLKCFWYGGSCTHTCDYFLLTGQRRGPLMGDDCIRFTPKSSRRRPKYIDYGGEHIDLQGDA